MSLGLSLYRSVVIAYTLIPFAGTKPVLLSAKMKPCTKHVLIGTTPYQKSLVREVPKVY